jgi:hypothetical protein
MPWGKKNFIAHLDVAILHLTQIRVALRVICMTDVSLQRLDYAEAISSRLTINTESGMPRRSIAKLI